MSNSSLSQGVQATPISLHLVTISHNPRKPLRKLQELGYDPLTFAREYALSDDADKRAHFVKVISENHPEIVELSKSIAGRTQIAPAILRSFREADSQIDNYGIAAGERRYIAMAYKQAETGTPQEILAIVRNISVEEAYWIGVDENLHREDMTEVEKGQVFAKYIEEKDKNLQECADHFHVNYNFVRGRHALATKLPEERLKLYEEGKLGLTDAIREALGDQKESRSNPNPGSRTTVLSLKDIRKLFDETPRSKTDRLQAFADVMQLDLQAAIAESDVRAEKQEELEARQVEREMRSKRRPRPEAR